MIDQDLPAELSQIVERVARHRRGLALLHQACLESAAVIFKVHPFVLEAARAYLATPHGRQVWLEEVKRAQLHPFSSSKRDTTAIPGDPGSELCREAKELIARAREHPLGVRVLINSTPEKVAEVFGVHPYIVFRALGALEREGSVPEIVRPGS